MKHRSLLSLAALGVLAACGSTDIKETLGLNHRAPDEFRVYQHPALSVPPEFALRPPEKGAEYSNGVPSDQQAHNKLLSDTGATALPSTTEPANTPTPPGTTHFLVAPEGSAPAAAVAGVTTNELPTSADSQFLTDAAGTTKIDPHVRDELDQGTGVAAKSGPYLFGNKKTDADSQVDPTKEAQRLKDDKAQDKPPTAGDTPVVQTQDKGWLGDIF